MCPARMLETIQQRYRRAAGGPVPPAPGLRARLPAAAMAHALFITCLADTLAPEVGRATVRVLERAGSRARIPARADLLRPDALQRRPRGRGTDPGPTIRRGVRRLRGDRDAVRLLRRARPDTCPDARAGRPRRAGPDTRALGVPARAGRRSTSVPRFAARSRTTRPVIRCACSGSATARSRSCGRWPGWMSSSYRTPRSAAASAAPSPSRTPTCRARCSTRSWTTSLRAAPMPSAPVTRRACMHIGGGLRRRGSHVRPVHLAEVLAP